MIDISLNDENYTLRCFSDSPSVQTCLLLYKNPDFIVTDTWNIRSIFDELNMYSELGERGLFPEEQDYDKILRS